MDFWPIIKNDLTKQDFGIGRYLLNTCDMQGVKDRHHTSFNLVKDSYREIKLNNVIESNFIEQRYIIATNLSFDLLISFYDVNNKDILIKRVYNKIETKDVERFIKKKNRNVEIRLIGLQNNQKDIIKNLLYLEKFGVLSEVDLFGNEIRHIAIDLKTGMTFNLLLENRIYRPGELLNQMSIQDFEKSIK